MLAEAIKLLHESDWIGCVFAGACAAGLMWLGDWLEFDDD